MELSNRIRKHKSTILHVVLILLGVAICIEIIRDLSRGGDFKGYVDAGNLALHRKNIYSDVYNTWPPFFSIFSIPLAWIDSLSPIINRLIWLMLTVLAFIATIDLSAKLLFNKKLSLNKNPETISIKNVLIIIPILLIFRYILDNLSNIQINIFLLYACILVYYFFTKSKFIYAALILAFIISLKVIPIFILFYFIYKKKWHVTIWTIIFIVLINALCLLYFGSEAGLQYYITWISKIAPSSYVAHRNNQSIIGFLLRLFTAEDTSIPFSIQIANLPKQSVIRLSYLIICISALIPAYIFRTQKGLVKSNLLNLIEFSFVVSAIAILSPISWKAYFIFLWFPYFILYFLLYHSKYEFNNVQLIKRVFTLSILMTTFTSEIFIGRYIGYRLEVCSVITLGTILVLILQLMIYHQIRQAHKKSVSLSETPF